MITRRTKIQLIFFVLITLVGVAFVGARYARLDRVIVDDAYTVVAHFEDSGGIFAGCSSRWSWTATAASWRRSATRSATVSC